MLLFAAAWLAVRAARRPSGTLYDGRPSCMHDGKDDHDAFVHACATN